MLYMPDTFNISIPDFILWNSGNREELTLANLEFWDYNIYVTADYNIKACRVAKAYVLVSVEHQIIRASESSASRVPELQALNDPELAALTRRR